MSHRTLTEVLTDEHGPRYEFAREEDRDKLRQWMAGDQDPSHHDMSPEFFLEGRTESRMYGDSQGDLFAVRLTRVLRLDIQFNPAPEVKERLMAALRREFPELIAEARNAGFRQLIFDSTVKPLIAFCIRRFGFRASPNEFRGEI